MGVFTTSMGKNDLETLASLSSQIPVHARVAIRPLVAAHRGSNGSIVMRDTLLLVPTHLLKAPAVRLRLLPGISIPTGSFGEATGFNLLSTGSVDPWLGADVLAGSAWLAGAALNVRAPLYPGTDGDRQGAYLRGNLRGARRIGNGAVWLGLSPVTALDSAAGRGSFTEVATTAGGVIPVGDRWAVNGQLRAPIIQLESRYIFSFGLGLSTVFDGRADPVPTNESTPIE